MRKRQTGLSGEHVYTRTEGWTNIHETVSFISVGVGVLIFSLCILMHSLTVLHILGRALRWLEVLIPGGVDIERT
jgi:hypothetical protein